MGDWISCICVSCNRILHTLCRTRRYRHTRVQDDNASGPTSETGPSYFQLIRMGCGRGLAIGVFVVVGQVSSQFTGASITVCLTIALTLALFTGLCFADVVNSVPSLQGAPFFFTYIRGGEFIAVIVGWSFLLSHMSISALSARAMAEHFDCMIGGKIQEFFDSVFPKVSPDGYPNLISLAIVIVVVGYVAIGAKRSTVSHHAANITSVMAVILVLVFGYVNGDGDAFSGGKFFYNGEQGVSNGAAVCFYLFTGYEVITTSIRTPHPHVLRKQVTSIIASSVLIFLAFILTGTFMLFLVSPEEMHPQCAFTSSRMGTDANRWVELILNIISLPVLGVSMATNLFIVVHSVYSMSSEGVIPSFFSQLNRRTDTPLFSAIAVGTITGILATVLSQLMLLQLSALGALFTHALICVCVALMRYRPVQTDDEEGPWKHEDTIGDDDTDHVDYSTEHNVRENGSLVNIDTLDNNNTPFSKITSLGKGLTSVRYTDTEFTDESSDSDRGQVSDDIDKIVEEYKEKIRVASLTHFQSKNQKKRSKTPTSFTLKVVSISMTVQIVCVCCNAAILRNHGDKLLERNGIVVGAVSFFSFFSIISSILIYKQPRRQIDWLSPVIMFPWMPLMCVSGCIYLMFAVDSISWIIFSIWIIMGVLVYAAYGTLHSVEAKRYTYVLPEEQEQVLLQPIPKQSMLMEISPGQRRYKQNIGYQYFHEMQ